MGKVNNDICKNCGKQYQYKRGCSYHRQQCQKLKSYNCSACQKGFTRKDSLQAHSKVCKVFLINVCILISITGIITT